MAILVSCSHVTVMAALIEMSPDISKCDDSSTHLLRTMASDILQEPAKVSVNELEVAVMSAYKSMEANANTAHSLPWRRFYTELSLLAALHVALQPRSELRLRDACSQLDKAIVLAGAPGSGRLDLIIDLIVLLQSLITPVIRSETKDNLSPPSDVQPTLVTAALATAPCLQRPPSLASFRSIVSQRPFVLPKHIINWPALNEHPWTSTSYLRSVAGPGRVVPVEIGSDYRTDDWTQILMGWDEFLDAIRTPVSTGNTNLLYLAQHNLMKQFPQLRDDIIIPDYAYACPPAPVDYPAYKPPSNEEELMTNVWFGPRGTMSPAHTVRRIH